VRRRLTRGRAFIKVLPSMSPLSPFAVEKALLPRVFFQK